MIYRLVIFLPFLVTVIVISFLPLDKSTVWLNEPSLFSFTFDPLIKTSESSSRSIEPLIVNFGLSIFKTGLLRFERVNVGVLL